MNNKLAFPVNYYERIGEIFSKPPRSVCNYTEIETIKNYTNARIKDEINKQAELEKRLKEEQIKRKLLEMRSEANRLKRQEDNEYFNKQRDSQASNSFTRTPKLRLVYRSKGDNVKNSKVNVTCNGQYTKESKSDTEENNNTESMDAQEKEIDEQIKVLEREKRSPKAEEQKNLEKESIGSWNSSDNKNNERKLINKVEHKDYTHNEETQQDKVGDDNDISQGSKVQDEGEVSNIIEETRIKTLVDSKDISNNTKSSLEQSNKEDIVLIEEKKELDNTLISGIEQQCKEVIDNEFNKATEEIHNKENQVVNTIIELKVIYK